MLRTLAVVLMIQLGVLASSIASADSWPGARLQIFKSATGEYNFRTRPPQLSTWSGKGQGTLYTLSADGSEKVMWGRDLVNIPVKAFITDTGTHVVTFDTWAKLGYEHSLVVYGEQGDVIADYDLDALLSADEIGMRVVETVGGRRWLQDATIAFDKDGTVIVIRLAWGKVIRVALSTGTIAAAS